MKSDCSAAEKSVEVVAQLREHQKIFFCDQLANFGR